ncbi:MAG: (2Fe-2S)-binding protein [Gammaproteobacteria bacterium]|jgi:bacterioferritin-associated ferredoxin
MFVCVCHAVTESDIDRALDEGAATLDHLKHRLDVATSCGCCSETIRECLARRQSLEDGIPDGAVPA